MRKLLFIVSVFSIALYSCNNDVKTLSSSQDSAVVKNDSALSDTLKEIANKEAEELSQDSIKQTHAAKMEDDSFEKKLPDPKKIFWNSDCGKYLKKLGFKGSSHPNDFAEFGCKTGTYTLNVGDKKCKVFFDDHGDSAMVEITISGDEKALDAYYKRAKKMAYKGSESEIHVTKKGDKVIIGGGETGF